MGRILLRRMLQAVAVVLFVATATFVLVHAAPGDPYPSSMESPYLSEAVRAQWRANYGLDRPLGEQYVRYLGRLAVGDLGPSFSQHRPVAHALADALPNTLLLMSVALVASFAAGAALGVLQGMRRRSPVDRALGGAALFFYSVPDFWLALVLMLCFAYWLPLFPASGMRDPVLYDALGLWGRIVHTAHRLVLPALTLTLLTAAGVARHQRAAMLDASHQDYVRTARAKGVGERRVMLRHVLRNALLPVITLLGLAIPALVGGAVLVEYVFAWPGMGYLMVQAIGQRDYPLVVGAVLVISVLVSVGSLVADLLYALADPRLRRA